MTLILYCVSRPDSKRSTRGNRRMPLSESQFFERPSNDSQGIWHPSPFEKRDTTQPIRYYSLRKHSNFLDSTEKNFGRTPFIKWTTPYPRKTVYMKI